MSNEHVAEPFRAIIEAAMPSTPAEIYLNIRNRALEEAAAICSRKDGEHFAAIGICDNERDKHLHGAKCAVAMELASAIRALKTEAA